jgi:hypothetical protein
LADIWHVLMINFVSYKAENDYFPAEKSAGTASLVTVSPGPQHDHTLYNLGSCRKHGKIELPVAE